MESIYRRKNKDFAHLENKLGTDRFGLYFKADIKQDKEKYSKAPKNFILFMSPN